MKQLRLHRDEDGMALMAALLAVVILTGLALVFMNRSITETHASGDSRDHEAAIHVAESAADKQLSFLNQKDNDDYVTPHRDGSDVEIFAADFANEKAWALDLLDDVRPAAPGDASDAWVESGTGQAYAVRPFLVDGSEPGPLKVIYAVGAVPSFDHPDAKVRVLKLQIDQDNYIPEFALLNDAALDFGGNAAIVVPGCDNSTPELAQRTCLADVHTNEVFTNPGNAATIQGRVSQVSGSCPGGMTAVNGCVDSGDGVEPKPVPEFSARDYYNRTDQLNPDASGDIEWYDLCPPGTPVAGASVRRPLGDQPCSAASEQLWPNPPDPSTDFRGWKWKPGGWHGSAIDAGVFYVYHADAIVNGTKTPGRRSASILVEQNPTSKATSGSIKISGNPQMEAALETVLLLADADLDMQGTATAGSCGVIPGALSGFIGVGEQLKTQGTVELRGAIIARDHADDHPLVKRNNDGVSGTMCLEFDPNLEIDFTGIWVITFWNEL